jgi:hypothetical protein
VHTSAAGQYAGRIARQTPPQNVCNMYSHPFPLAGLSGRPCPGMLLQTLSNHCQNNRCMHLYQSSGAIQFVTRKQNELIQVATKAKQNTQSCNSHVAHAPGAHAAFSSPCTHMQMGAGLLPRAVGQLACSSSCSQTCCTLIRFLHLRQSTGAGNTGRVDGTQHTSPRQTKIYPGGTIIVVLLH